MHGNRGLVQLEMRIVRVRLVHAVVVLAGREVRFGAHGLRTIIARPVVESVRAGRWRRRRASGGATDHLDNLGYRRNRAHVGAVGVDRVVDGYLILLPYREHGVIGEILVGRDLRRHSTTRAPVVVCAIGIVEQIGRSQILRPVGTVGLPRRSFCSCSCRIIAGADINARPTAEGITLARRCGRDIHPSVDLEILVLLECIFAGVLIPIYMCRRGLLGVDVLGLQADGVLLSIRGAARRSDVFHLGVAGKYGVRIAGIDLDAGRLPIAAVPLLNHPVAEHLVAVRRRLRRCASRGLGAIDIRVGISGSTSAAICVVFNDDTGSAVERRTPLGVNIELRGDPETLLTLAVGSGFVTS